MRKCNPFFFKVGIICVSLFIFLVVYSFFNPSKVSESFTKKKDIPIFIICYNNAFFVKNFVNQLKKYKQKIILINNNSEQPELYDYFKKIKKELGNRVEIRHYKENHGHEIYLKLADSFPPVYMLSDPDLQLNPNLPNNFVDILYNLSEKHKVYKVGFALDISDHEKFITCDKDSSMNIFNNEKNYWTTKLEDPKYELYKSPIDTTFCLINQKYYNGPDLYVNKYEGIRIAGNFTAKHLPWYKGYIKKNVPKKELEIWKKHNSSSSILNCISL